MWGDLEYDKIGQTKWLVNLICDRCKVAWNLREHMIIDKMTIRYKSMYNSIH